MYTHFIHKCILQTDWHSEIDFGFWLWQMKSPRWAEQNSLWHPSHNPTSHWWAPAAGRCSGSLHVTTDRKAKLCWLLKLLHPLPYIKSEHRANISSLPWTPFQLKESPSSCTASSEQVDTSQNSTVGNTLPLTSSSHSNQIVNKQSILHRWTNNATLIQLPRTIFCAHSIKSSHSACSSLETRTGSPSEGEKEALTDELAAVNPLSLCSTFTSCLHPLPCMLWPAATSLGESSSSLSEKPRIFTVERNPQGSLCPNPGSTKHHPKLKPYVWECSSPCCFCKTPIQNDEGSQRKGEEQQLQSGYCMTLVSSLCATSRSIFLRFVYLSTHFTSQAVVWARFGYGKEGQESKSTDTIFKVCSISLKVRLLEATGWCIARDYLSQAVPLKCTRFKSVANRRPEAHQQPCCLGPGKSKELAHPSICTPDRRDVKQATLSLAFNPSTHCSVCLGFKVGATQHLIPSAQKGLIRKWISEELL